MSFKTYLNKGTGFADNVTFAETKHDFANDGFGDSIGVLQQRSAQSYQQIFKPNSFDEKEFSKGLQAGYKLVRVSTSLSKPGSSFYRTIARVNIKTGKIGFIDDEAYENEEKVVWKRPYKLEFVRLPPEGYKYFS